MSILKIEPAVSNSSANFTFGNVFASNFYYANGTIFSGGGSGTVKYTATTTPPSSNNSHGDQWYNVSTQVLYEYINDGTGNYWVDILSPTLGQSSVSYLTNTIVNGNSNVMVSPNGNISLNSSDVSNVLLITSTGTITTGTTKTINGFYSTNNYTGTFTDGIVVDYVDGNGRISVGTADGIKFYNGGVANNLLASIDINGNIISGNANLGNAVTSNYFVGNGYYLTNIPTSAITGTISTATTATTAGTVTTNAQPNITTVGTLTSLTVTGLVTMQQSTEIVTTLTGATGNVTHNLTVSSTFYHTSPAASFTANFTNVPTTTGRAIATVLLVAQGGTPYVPSAVQIDGVAQTVLWASSTAPTGTASKTDVFGFTLQRTDAGAWLVYGSYGNYG